MYSIWPRLRYLPFAVKKHGWLGSPGYGLPVSDNFVIESVAECVFRGQCSIDCTSDVADRNWIVRSLESDSRSLKFIFTVQSDSNVIIIDRNSHISGDIKISGQGNLLVMGGGQSHPSAISVAIAGSSGLFFWGRGSTANGLRAVLSGHETSLVVGEDCMFASAITMRTSDMHPMFNLSDGVIINPPGNILIEPRVWISQDSMILKNSHIGFGSIIGAKSLVSGKHRRYSLIAGVPAKEIRSGVSWNRPFAIEPATISSLQAFEQRMTCVELSQGETSTVAAERSLT